MKYTMKEFVKEAILPMAMFGMAILILMAAMLTPIYYLTGSANSAWLKKSRGIDIPWCQAAFLDIRINEIDASVQSK